MAKKKCDCGAKLTTEIDKINGMCKECVQGLADEIDREMLGDEDFKYFKDTGYFDDHDAFGDKS